MILAMNVDWLRGTWYVSEGTALLICGLALLFFVLLAVALEMRTRNIYYNHDKKKSKKRKNKDAGENGLLGDLIDFGDDDDEDDGGSTGLSDMIKSARADLDDWDPDAEPDGYDFDDETDDKPKKAAKKTAQKTTDD